MALYPLPSSLFLLMKKCDHLKEIESKAEYALRRILLYFQPALSYHLLGYRKYFLWYIFMTINWKYFLQ